jgi:hypothetical protein
VEQFTLLADDFKDVENRIGVTVHNPGGGADAQPFGQELHDLDDLAMLYTQPIQRV